LLCSCNKIASSSINIAFSVDAPEKALQRKGEDEFSLMKAENIFCKQDETRKDFIKAGHRLAKLLSYS
jgi:hypothetical protein